MDSQPQCHPEKSRARTDQDLQAEQDEFFLSGAQTSVKLLSSDNKETKHHCYTPSLPVLSDVIENDQRIKPITAPVMKAPLKPIKLTRKVTEPSIPSNLTSNLDDLKREISTENDEKLAKMSAEEIEALKRELFENIPESLLDKLRK